MEFSVPNVFGLLIRSRLLSADEVRAMFAALARTEAKATDASDVGQFANWLVANQYVTEYQASLLARGLPITSSSASTRSSTAWARAAWPASTRPSTASARSWPSRCCRRPRPRTPNCFGRFQREARLALQLKHPNVVRTFQVGEANGLHYLVMEYLEGETLDEVLKRRGKLPPPRRSASSTRRCWACSTSTSRAWSTATSSRPT